MLRVFRTRNYNVAALCMPAQDNLCVGFPVNFPKMLEQRLFNQNIIPLYQPIQRHKTHICL